MFDYIPRIIFHIIRSFFLPQINIQEDCSVHFRVWPFLDTDGFRMMGAGKYPTLASVVAWVHGYRSGFLHASLKHKWMTVTKRSSIQFFRPAKVLRRIRVTTRIVTWSDQSTLRLVEFFDQEKLCAQLYMELVVMAPKRIKISPAEYLKEIGFVKPAYHEWPKELESWKN